MEIADIRVFKPAAVDRYRICEEKNMSGERKNKVVYTQTTTECSACSIPRWLSTIRNNNDIRKPTEKIQFSHRRGPGEKGPGEKGCKLFDRTFWNRLCYTINNNTRTMHMTYIIILYVRVIKINLSGLIATERCFESSYIIIGRTAKTLQHH